MEHAPEFEAFIRDLMPDATPEERELAMQSMDDYIQLLLRIADRMERRETNRIRENPEQGV